MARSQGDRGDRQDDREHGPEPIEIGLIARAHGVRGELRLRLHNPESRALELAEELWIGGCWHALESARPTNGAILIRLEGVSDRNRAEALKGERVAVARDCLGLEDDDVLLVDMVGLTAVLADGRAWGEVTGVESGAQNRLVIKTAAGVFELPLVEAFVGEVDLEKKTVVVDPPDDLPEA